MQDLYKTYRNFVSCLKTAPGQISSSPNFVIRKFRSYTKYFAPTQFVYEIIDFVYEKRFRISKFRLNFHSSYGFETKFHLQRPNLDWDEIPYTKFRLARQFRIRKIIISYTKFRLWKISLTNFRIGGGYVLSPPWRGIHEFMPPCI